MQLFLNIFLFYIGWFSAVLGAARGDGLIGPFIIAACCLLHLYIQKKRWQREVVAMFAVMFVGTLLDGLLPLAGKISFQSSSVSFFPQYPAWMSFLWLGFASTYSVSLAWLKHRPITAAVFGFIGGPLSYIAVEALGALTINGDRTSILALIAVVWGLAVPATLAVHSHFIPVQK